MEHLFMYNEPCHSDMLPNKPIQAYPIERANKMQAELQKVDEEWRYTVVKTRNNPKYAYIAVYDEDSEFIAYWEN